MLRIIGGTYRSRHLAVPDDSEVTRPWTGLAREAVFNLLRGWSEDARVLDLFCGVGSMGLEALSRGAREVIFVEKSRSIVRLLNENIATLGCGDRARVIQGDALSAAIVAQCPAPVDLVFIDPPYAQMEDPVQRAAVLAQARRCRSIMGDKGFVVLRSPLDPARVPHAIEGFDGPEVHRYGQGMYVLLYAPAAMASGTRDDSAAPHDEGDDDGDDA